MRLKCGRVIFKKGGNAKVAETRKQKRVKLLNDLSSKGILTIFIVCVVVFMRRKPLKLKSGLAVNFVILGFMLLV